MLFISSVKSIKTTELIPDQASSFK